VQFTGVKGKLKSYTHTLIGYVYFTKNSWTAGTPDAPSAIVTNTMKF
jgi:hypothetical protein